MGLSELTGTLESGGLLNWRVVVAGVLGTAVTVLGVLLLLAPSVVYAGPLASLPAGVTENPTLLMFVAGVAATLYLGFAARSPRAAATADSLPAQRFEDVRTNPPEAVTADRRLLAAATIDREMQAAIRIGGPALQSVRSLLFDTAVHAYGTATEVSREAAQDAIERGTWTDDRMAASFLAGPDGPRPALIARLRLWVAPERERGRRIERTLAAIERLQERS